MTKLGGGHLVARRRFGRYGEGIYTTVGESQLRDATSHGWELVSSFTVEIAIPLHEGMMSSRDREQAVKDAVNTNHLAAWASIPNECQPFREAVVKVRHYLLRKDTESELGQRSADLEAKRMELHAARDEERRLRQELKNQTERAESAEKLVRENYELATGLQELLTGERAKKHAMEKDLGKVREAIGALRFKEIVEGSSTK